MRKILSLVVVFIYLSQFILPTEGRAAGALTSFSQLSAQADPHTGSANFGIPIEVAQGRGGIQPNLQISYNSSSPNGIFGTGWGLELGSIKRSTKKGPPKYDANDLFFLSNNGDVQELILDTSAGTGIYRSKVEGSFLKIQLSNNVWTVTDKSGTKYFFGQTAASQEFDPSNTSRISEWAIDRVEDIHGNYMTFEYAKDNNTLYPYRINYTGLKSPLIQPFHTVEFEKEIRPDGGFDQYTNGYTSRLNYRINKIKVFAAGNLQRSYVFNYITSASTGRNLISKVTQFAANSTTSLPAIEFTYQDAKDTTGNSHQLVSYVNQAGSGDHLWNYRKDTNYDRGNVNYGPCSSANMCNSVNWGPQTLVGDASGSFSLSTSSKIAHWYWTYVYSRRNKTISVPYTTNGTTEGIWINGSYGGSAGRNWQIREGWNLIEINIYSQTQSVNFNLNHALASDVDITYMGSSQALVGQITGDFNADGFSDLANLERAVGRFSVSLSTGSGFQPSTVWLSNILATENVVPSDFNGDGRMDVALVNSTGSWKVALSDGTKFALPVSWIDTPWGANSQTSSVDFNNDGLSDALRYFDGGMNQQAQVNYNNGTKFTGNTSAIINIGPNAYQNFPADFNGDGLVDFGLFNPTNGRWVFNINPGTNTSTFISWPDLMDFGTNRNIVVADINSDGKTDIGYYEFVTGRIRYRISLGNSFEATTEFPQTLTSRDPQTQVQVSDMNGDTIADFVIMNTNGVNEIAYSNGQAPDLLVQVKNGVGAVSTITYGPVVKFLNTALPFPIQVVSSVKISNSLGQTYTTQNSYEKGVWSVSDREFRGFGLVKSIDPDGNYSETEFLQDDIYKGRIKEQRTFDSTGKLYGKVAYTWSTPQAIAPGVSFIFLKRKDNFVYDGDSTGRRTAEEFFYDDSPQYGNLTKVVQYGEVDLTTGADITGDTRTVETQYVNNPTSWILGLPKLTTVKDNAGAFVRKTWFNYDTLANGATPTKGLLTQKENWGGDQAGAQKPTTKYSYDSYGNLKTTTDPKNNITTINYDGTYNLFPLTTLNALNHTITNEYYGIGTVSLNSNDGYQGLWGQLKSTTDPNLQKGQRTYDIFGRPTASVSPVDSIAFPTSKSEYTLGSPMSLLTSRARVKTGEARTIDSFDAYDGLGRLVLSKRFGPEANQYIVSGLTTYNSRGLPSRQFLPYYSTKPLSVPEVVTESDPNTLTEYDPMGRVIKVTNPDGTYSTNAYKDWTTISIDENGHKQESDFDAYGRLMEKREYLGADGRSPHYPTTAFTLYATTKYKYDSEGNLKETRDQYNNLTTITYNVLGQKTEMNDPDMKLWKYTYDLNGNLLTQTDAKGQTITFTYDALNRLTRKTDGAALDVNYTYEDNAVLYSKGRLTKAAYPNQSSGLTNFKYDKMGRETQSKKQIDTLVYNVDRNYQALNQLTDVTYPDTANVLYEYNLAGQVMAAANDSALLPNSGTPGNPPSGTQTLEAPYVHYKMNDNAATSTVADAGTGNNPATASANTSVLTSAGKLGLGLHLDGVSQRIDLSSFIGNIKTDDVGSVSFWFKADEVKYATLFALSSTQNSAGFTVQMLEDGRIYIYATNGTTNFFHQYSNITFAPNVWHHLTITQNKAGVKFYANGVQLSVTDTSPNDQNAWFNQANSASLDRCRIGNFYRSDTGENFFFKGTVDDFRYYKRGLTADEVEAIYNNGNGVETSQITYTP